MVFVVTLVFLFAGTTAFLLASGGTFGGAIDIPSMFVVVTTIFMSLVGGGCVRDFFRALKIAASKKEFPPRHLTRAESAVNLVMHSLLASCGMVLFMCATMLLSLWADKSSFGPVLALGLLTVLYTAEVITVLLPVKSILHKKISKSAVHEHSESLSSMRNIPLVPVLSFLIGITIFFFLISIQDTFLLSNYPEELMEIVPLVLLGLVLSSYVFLFAGKMLGSFFRALGIGLCLKNSATKNEIEEASRAINFAITIRIILACAFAVIRIICVFSTVESREDLPFEFSVPLIFIATAFFSALFLLPIRTRIEKI